MYYYHILRSVHALKGDSKVPGKLRSKLTLKYSGSKLQEKGVLLEVEGLPPAQLRNVNFEISPSEMSGVFTVRAKFMGVEMEKIDVDIQVSICYVTDFGILGRT